MASTDQLDLDGDGLNASLLKMPARDRVNSTNVNVSPRMGLTLKQKKAGGGMAARRAKMNLQGVPGLSTGSKLDFIHNKADELAAKIKEQAPTCFKSQYMFDDPPKVLGQGMHAMVFKCYKISDKEKKFPFAAKVAREPDEEKRMAHEKEFKITNKMNHKNIVKSTDYFFDKLTEEIHLVMNYVQGQEVLD